MTGPADPLAALLGLIREAARQGTADALAAAEPRHSAPAALLTKQELAAALAISPGQVDRLVRRGALPFVPVGDHKRFDLAAVLSELGNHEVRVAAAPKPSTGAASSGVRLLTRGTGAR